jgi:predicted permease
MLVTRQKALRKFWYPVMPEAALPAASNGFIIAQRYGLEVGSISSSIVIGTVISLVTVSFAVWVLPLP